jgi:hypothetical protein
METTESTTQVILPVLKTKVKTVHQVDCRDLQRHIEQVYGHSFSIQADLETGNDMSIERSYTKAEAPDELELQEEELEEFKSAGKSSSSVFDLLMNDMVLRDLIPEGDYIISLSW